MYGFNLVRLYILLIIHILPHAMHGLSTDYIPITTSNDSIILDHATAILGACNVDLSLPPLNRSITSEWICRFLCHCLKYPRPLSFLKGPRNPIPYDIVVELLKRVKDIYELQPSLIHIPYICNLGDQYPWIEDHYIHPKDPFITILGDTHGQFIDTVNILVECGIFGLDNGNNLILNPLNRHILFNGDIIDRGEMSLELLLLILSLKLFASDMVHINRGNHEDGVISKEYGYKKSIDIAYINEQSKVIFDLSQELFDVLPLATVIYDQVIVLHGGLPRFSNITLNMIKEFPRKEFKRWVKDSFNNTCMIDILWSDPFPDNELDEHVKQLPQNTEKIFYFDNPYRGSIYYTRHLLEEFLTRNNLKLVVRSHEAVCSGFDIHHQGQLLTLFSAPYYARAIGNTGAVLHIYTTLGNNYTLFGHVQQFMTRTTFNAAIRASCRNPRRIMSKTKK